MHAGQAGGYARTRKRTTDKESNTQHLTRHTTCVILYTIRDKEINNMTKTTMCKAVVACMVGAMLAGCGNTQLIDTTWSYDEAIIVIGGEEVARGQVTSWRDYSDSDVVQVRMADGTTYYTHSTNVVLIDNPNK